MLIYENCLFCRFCERAQALIHGDLHTSSIMVTQDSTQVIDPEFAFVGPMGFDVGAYLGNLILAYSAQDGHADQRNDRKVCCSVYYNDVNIYCSTISMFHLLLSSFGLNSIN